MTESPPTTLSGPSEPLPRPVSPIAAHRAPPGLTSKLQCSRDWLQEYPATHNESSNYQDVSLPNHPRILRILITLFDHSTAHSFRNSFMGRSRRSSSYLVYLELLSRFSPTLPSYTSSPVGTCIFVPAHAPPFENLLPPARRFEPSHNHLV